MYFIFLCWFCKLVVPTYLMSFWIQHHFLILYLEVECHGNQHIDIYVIYNILTNLLFLQSGRNYDQWIYIVVITVKSR